jgi:hypothetical protein
MSCTHTKLIDLVEDIEKAKKKDPCIKCFTCGKVWTRKQWEEILREKKNRIVE